MIKEQGKCFELARTGRELILLLREDENNEGVEDLLNVSPLYFLPRPLLIFLPRGKTNVFREIYVRVNLRVILLLQ